MHRSADGIKDASDCLAGPNLTREAAMFYRWLAIAVVGLHFGYLAYLVAGGYLAWRWPRSLVLHVVAVVWAVLVVAAKVPCPLTWLQNTLREHGGQRRLEMSFIDRYVRGVFFPADHEIATRALVGLIVAVAWFGPLVRRAQAANRVARRARK